MDIDQSRYETFWQNPERYRQIYELNLVPKAPAAYGLQRGIAFHAIINLSLLGWNEASIRAALSGEKVLPDGRRLEPIAASIQAKALALYAHFVNWLEPNGFAWDVLETEKEFSFPLTPEEEDTWPHTGMGRLDVLAQAPYGKVICEYKTAYSGAKFDRVAAEWGRKIQADFLILGGRALGHDIVGVQVFIIVEKTPPEIWPLPLIKRSEYRLNLAKQSAAITCDFIVHLLAYYTSKRPWPHLSNWPCNSTESCGYEGICSRYFDKIPAEDLAEFKPREEHLACLRKSNILDDDEEHAYRPRNT